MFPGTATMFPFGTPGIPVNGTGGGGQFIIPQPTRVAVPTDNQVPPNSGTGIAGTGTGTGAGTGTGTGVTSNPYL